MGIGAGRRGIQNGGDSQIPGHLQRILDHIKVDFQLRDQYIGRGNPLTRGINIRLLDAKIRSQDHDDHILARAINQDWRHAGGMFIVLPHVIAVDTFGIPKLVGQVGKDNLFPSVR